MSEKNLEQIAQALKNNKGHFVINTDEEDLVIMTKKEYDRQTNQNAGIQLELQSTAHTPKEDDQTQDQEDLEEINRELAAYHAAQELYDDLTAMSDEDYELGPRKKVKFEPIKGDLPPDLQE